LSQALVQLLRTRLADRHAMLDELVAAQAQLDGDLATLRGRPLQHRGTLAALVTHDMACVDALASLQAAAAADPGLQADAEIVVTLADLGRVAERLAAARRSFNDAAQSYDDAIAQFPTRLLVRWFGFQRAGRY
jgi:LemA protein